MWKGNLQEAILLLIGSYAVVVMAVQNFVVQSENIAEKISALIVWQMYIAT
jgi:hypothetical protein